MSRWLWADIKGRVVNLDRVDEFIIDKGHTSDTWFVIAVQNGKRISVFQHDSETACHEWLSRQLAVDDAQRSPTFFEAVE